MEIPQKSHDTQWKSEWKWENWSIYWHFTEVFMGFHWVWVGFYLIQPLQWGSNQDNMDITRTVGFPTWFKQFGSEFPTSPHNWWFRYMWSVIIPSFPTCSHYNILYLDITATGVTSCVIPPLAAGGATETRGWNASVMFHGQLEDAKGSLGQTK